MTQTINVPGVGQLQFPDGMSQPDMAAAIQRNFPQIHAPGGATSADIPATDPGGLGTNRAPQSVDTARPLPQPALLVDPKTKEDTMLGRIYGPLEAAASIGTGMVGGMVGMVRGGPLGAFVSHAKNAHEMEKEGADLAESLTYQPRTQTGQKIAGAIGNAITDSGVMGVPIPELNALGRALPITRALGRASPVVEQAAPVIDYDVPTYKRMAGPPRPLPEIAGPVKSPEMIGPPAPDPVIAPPVVPVPTLPPSIPGPVMRSPLDAYAAAPMKSPYGELLEPLAPEAHAVAQSPLDAYASRPEQPRAMPNRFDDVLRENLPVEAPKSPLEAMAAGEPSSPAARITAPLRDTSDIDSILQSFGVRSPEAPIAGPAPLAMESVERATAPATPLAPSMVAPEPIPGPRPLAALSEVVERANGQLAPLDAAMRVPEPVAAAAPEVAPAAPMAGPVALREQAAPAPMPGPPRHVAPEAVAADDPFVATPERHVDPASREQNLQALRDVGMENIRESAISGNAAQAAREFQHGKITSEPAGMHWFDQFQTETEAMKNHVQRIVDGTAGRTGLDESSMTRKGMDIAAPYDAAREYFEKAKTALYNDADKAAGGLPNVKLDGLAKMLDTDSTFEGRAEKSALRKGIRAYLREQSIVDADGNMQPITAKTAEGLRKYLNGEWSPQNAGLIGKIKGALDNDVYDSAGAGSDIYAAGRAMHQLEKQTLDNPNGIAKIMDSDPYTPVNRNTDFHKIPDKIMTLSEDQFKHIIDTYRNLPPELQPLSERAIATLKSHYAEKMLDAGAESGRGNPRQLWNTGGVKTFVGDNSAKIPMLFDMGELKQIDSMLKAGEVLRVNPAYPGAAAQLANASKAGLMSNLLGRAGGGLGGLVGAVTAGPAGAAAGGLAGEAAAGALLKRSGERAALAAAKKAIINEHRQAPMPPMSPVEEWESGLRQ